MNNASKNDVAWNRIFNDFDIINTVKNKGSFEITSSTINRYREARLMTKFDYYSQLPKIFKDNHFSLLPITRGSYVISTFQTFKTFESQSPDIVNVEFPDHLESIDYNNITSEATAINCAFLSGIFNDFTEEEVLYPTINGRMSSSEFNFIIKTFQGPLPVQIQNSQIEIDAGFEGLQSLYIIEAKNTISNDFLIRQLYYPYRLWISKVNKPVKLVFLTYSNGIFHLREFSVDSPNEYNSIRQIKEKRYAFKGEAINIETISNILKNSIIQKEPQIPFPQANSFERVINLCELLKINDSLSRQQVTEEYDFDIRQTNYYTDAGRYLGLISKRTSNNTVEYFLSKKGNEIFNLPITQRITAFIKLLTSFSSLNQTLNLYLKNGEPPSKKEIVEIMKESQLYRINSDSTFFRRASTVKQWINWILEQIDE